MSADTVGVVAMDYVKPASKEEFIIKVEPESGMQNNTSFMEVDVEEAPVPPGTTSTKKLDSEIKSTRRVIRKRISATTPNGKVEKAADVIELSDDGDSVQVVTKDAVDKGLKTLSYQNFRHEK